MLFAGIDLDAENRTAFKFTWRFVLLANVVPTVAPNAEAVVRQGELACLGAGLPWTVGSNAAFQAAGGAENAVSHILAIGDETTSRFPPSMKGR